ncbi:MAG: hypothetical protein WC584_05595 [Candidatus Pacearchaeota archaeon]
MNFKSQASVEYMIIIGFVTLAVIVILGMAYFYSDLIKDRIRMNQIETFAVQLINSAESVFFSGEPSKTSVRLYLPENVRNLEIDSSGIALDVLTSSGINKRYFSSRVPLQGNISSIQGVKIISIEAKNNYVLLS